jgi:8-oxo-dGTP pyrophosphatase MutT (NUDIX family)
MDTPIRATGRSSLFAVDPTEVASLAARFGQPRIRRQIIQADEYMYARRWRSKPDRRGEVVFAIRQPDGTILLHTKHSYKQPIFRLLSGGINPDEPVEQALQREVLEETGQEATIKRFIGVLDCRFVYDGSIAPFASYVFYLESGAGQLKSSDGEILCYKRVTLPQLVEVAAALRQLDGERRCWGFWRSLAHDLVCEVLLPDHEGLTR